MKVCVNTLLGANFEIEVDPTSKVADVKKVIETTQGQHVYPADRQLLIHMGKVLKDGTTLEENDVAENMYLDLVMRKVSGYVKKSKEIPVPPIDLPPIDLQEDLGELLQSEVGADVTFIVSGESLRAHKNVLAARFPVFMAEFFGGMKERTSKCVVIEEMEAAVFKAMLYFIYIDTVPELDYLQGTVPAMAQHLLVAADRYGLNRLKMICERRIAQGIDAGTVLATLALAEQHNCSQLKAMCIEFIVEQAPENLDAIMASEEFKSLEASNPAMLTELFKAAHRRIKK